MLSLIGAKRKILVSTLFTVVGNGTTWDRFEPRTENQKIKLKNMNFVF